MIDSASVNALSASTITTTNTAPQQRQPNAPASAASPPANKAPADALTVATQPKQTPTQTAPPPVPKQQTVTHAHDNDQEQGSCDSEPLPKSAPERIKQVSAPAPHKPEARKHKARTPRPVCTISEADLSPESALPLDDDALAAF